ncbi:hypothetical protein [Paenibacillus xylaniclasticus]|uniref:hypothetical protein n=1 Tax=Paenibacillus xylaniclasticus TaxID=588083 RepID=UPI000FD92387|nr:MULTISPECIES: hypothetical protein [Paenibacillus]GFN33970.1 hypothetical protein PCURB6_42300 [Paenibacillus curdlanolyticus]
MEDKDKSNGEQSKEPRRISLAEAMKRKLQEKMQAQFQSKGQPANSNTGVKKLQSQIKKKPNNQKRRTGV